MATFSEIVDNVAEATGRVNSRKLPSVVNAVNNTLRDFTENANELSRSEFAFVHPTARFNPPTAFEKVSVPLPSDFESMEAITTDLKQTVHRVKPGMQSLLSEGKNRYYIADGKIHISACFREQLNFSYFKVRRGFLYYAPQLRLLRSNLTPEHNTAYEYRLKGTPDWFPYVPSNSEMAEVYTRHVDWVTDLYGYLIEMGAKSTLQNEAGNLDIGSKLFTQYNAQKTVVLAGRAVL